MAGGRTAVAENEGPEAERDCRAAGLDIHSRSSRSPPQCPTPTRLNPMNTRRQFLIRAPMSLAAAVAACRGEERPAAPGGGATPTTAGAPPTFGTAPPVGPT